MLVYAAVKFFAYTAWCYLGLRSVRAAAGQVAMSIRLGAVRWMLGLLFGVAVFFLIGSIDVEAVARTYVLVYTPVRAIEWGIMIVLIARRSSQAPGARAAVTLGAWYVGGLLLSFATDLLSPEGLQGRFCVGRCLC